MWMNLIHKFSLTRENWCDCFLWPETDCMRSFSYLGGHSWVPLLPSRSFNVHVHQRVERCDVLFLPPSPLPISSLLHHSHQTITGWVYHTHGCRRRPLCTLCSQYLSLDSLKLNGCECSWAVSTSLGDGDIGRLFPVLPLTFLLCLSLLCHPFL